MLLQVDYIFVINLSSLCDVIKTCQMSNCKYYFLQSVCGYIFFLYICCNKSSLENEFSFYPNMLIKSGYICKKRYV